MTARLLKVSGWLLISAGLLVFLYLAYTLLYTNLRTERAQSQLLEEWSLDVGEVDTPAPGTTREPADGPGPPSTEGESAPAPVEVGDALAVLEFSRPGSEERPVHAEPLFIVEGVGLDVLRRGPGHYPKTDLPGQAGNFAVAGHRSTYGAPFFHLDQLRPGDEVRVTDRSGTPYVYRVVEQRVVAPTDLSVLADDPLGGGRPTLTLTTCNPRFSNRERLIVFAELVA
jgi:sortase A